ncbi:MAG: cytochrome c oxidase subunit I [Anaerolineae bacterium]
MKTSGTTYLSNDFSAKSWLLAMDHKRVALLYLVSISAFFVLGGLAALLLRLELLTPAADLVNSAAFKQAYTMHGFLMVFFGLLPAVPAILGNFLVPLMIGARNVAFPRLNILGWYLFVLAGMLLLSGAIVGGVDTGWVFYASYSANPASLTVLLTGAGLVLVSMASVLMALNFVATIHKMRAPGMLWERLPLFVWTIYVASIVMLVGTPLLIVTVALVLAESLLAWGIFSAELGGDPVLFQHLFWFYGNQIAFAIVLPAVGILAEIFTAAAQQRLYGYRVVVPAIWGVALLGFLSWPVHLVNANVSAFVALFGSFFAFATIFPFSIIIFSLIATLYHGRIRFNSPMLFALGGLGLLLLGGITRAFLSTLVLARHLQGTYFATAHWHFVVAGAVMALRGGLHFWWPKISGRSYSEPAAKLAAIIIFVATNLALWPALALGYLGMPRHAQWYPVEFAVPQVAITLGVSLVAVGILLPLLYLTASLFGARAAANPWQAKGLEWEAVASPPIPGNFSEPPLVGDGPYDYPHESGDALLPPVTVVGAPS